MDSLEGLAKLPPVIEVHAQGSPGRGLGKSGDFLSLLLERFAAKENTPPAMDVLMAVFARKAGGHEPPAPPARDERPEQPDRAERPEPPRCDERPEPPRYDERREPPRDTAPDEAPDTQPEPEYEQDDAARCEPPVEEAAAAPTDGQSPQQQADAPKADAPPDETAPSTEQPPEGPAQPAIGSTEKTEGQQLPTPLVPDQPVKLVDAGETPADDGAELIAAEQTPSPKPGESPAPEALVADARVAGVPVADASAADVPMADADTEGTPPEEPEVAQQPKSVPPAAERPASKPHQDEPTDAADEDAAQDVQVPSREPQVLPERMPHEPAQLRGGEDRAGAGESPGVAPHNAPLIDAEPADRVPSLSDGQPLAASLGTAVSADAVASTASATGANVSSFDGEQVGAHAQLANTTAQNAASAAGAEAAERLDAVFKQVLSTARLPLDMQKRIDLARSIGQQVIRGALVSVRDGRTLMTLQLRPPSLGTVRIQLMGEGKVVSARLTVDSPLVRQAVEQHVQQLRSMLREEGFQLERFEVSVRNQSGSNPWASDHAEEGNGHGQRARASAADETHDEDNPTLLDEAATVPVAVHDGVVDYLA